MSTLIPPKEVVKMPDRLGRGALWPRLVGKYFLFRNVPKDISWLQTLGASCSRCSSCR